MRQLRSLQYGAVLQQHLRFRRLEHVPPILANFGALSGDKHFLRTFKKSDLEDVCQIFWQTSRRSSIFLTNFPQNMFSEHRFLKKCGIYWAKKFLSYIRHLVVFCGKFVTFFNVKKEKFPPFFSFRPVFFILWENCKKTFSLSITYLSENKSKFMYYWSWLFDGLWNLVGAPKLAKSAEHMSLGIVCQPRIWRKNVWQCSQEWFVTFVNPSLRPPLRPPLKGTPVFVSDSATGSKSDKHSWEHCQNFVLQILVWQRSPGQGKSRFVYFSTCDFICCCK